MLGMAILLVIAFFAIKSLFTGDYSDSTDNDDNSDYDYGDSYSSGSDTEERFENRYPYEYDKETEYSRSDYCNNGNWTDCVGNQYEQVTDCWGHVSSGFTS